MTDSTPASGNPIKVHCSQGHSKTETLTITSTPASIKSSGIDIAGTKSMTATNVADAVTFDVTLAEAGSYAFVVTNSAGALRSSQTVVVHAADAPAPAATGKLSRTGFDATGLAIGGGLLVLAGAGAAVVAKRRKSSQAAA